MLGTLDLTNDPYVRVQDGLTIVPPSGETNSTIVFGSADLYFNDAETLSHTVLVLGAPGGPQGGVLGSGDTLTLDNTTTLLAGTGSNVQIGGNGTLINDGLILATGTDVTENDYQFTNAGTLTLGGSENFYINGGNSFTNTGVINIGSGATLSNYFQIGFSNSGLINIAAGGTLQTNGYQTLATLGDLTGGGTLDITGTLDLQGGTLDLSPGSIYANLRLDGGTLENGTVIEDGATLGFNNQVYLDNITLDGEMQTDGASVYLLDSFVGAQTDGSLPGTIDMSPGGGLGFTATATLDHVKVISSGNGTSANGIYMSGNDQTLTLGAHAIYQQDGGVQNIQNPFYYYYDNAFVNDGSLNLSGGVMGFSGLNVTNAGTITLAAGESVSYYNYSQATETFINTGLIEGTGQFRRRHVQCFEWHHRPIRRHADRRRLPGR